MEKKSRVWEVVAATGPFRFFADSKELALDHAHQLRLDPGFQIETEAADRVRFVGWQVEGTL